MTEQKWDEARIGIVMSVATIAGILAQTPAGALVDTTRTKPALMIAAKRSKTARPPQTAFGREKHVRADPEKSPAHKTVINP